MARRYHPPVKPRGQDLRLLHCPSDAPRPSGFPSDPAYPANHAPYSYLMNAWNDYFKTVLDADEFRLYLSARTHHTMSESLAVSPNRDPGITGAADSRAQGETDCV